jgi:acyl-CoA thioester hydrolase
LESQWPSFSFAVRVYYEDTDAAGVVYYANYLRFIERARSEWLRSLGLELDAVEREQAVVFPVRALTAEYHRPARLAELLDVHTRPLRLGGASLELWQAVERAGEQLFSCRVTLACVDCETFRPKAIPASMRDLVQRWKTPWN